LTSGIPTTYSIQNLPLDTPMIVFAFSSGSNQIGMCSSDLVISIFNSKGLTKRNI